MQISKVNDWLQLAASVGVLAGLLLVSYEIRQNNELAEAESVRAQLESWNTILISEYETELSDALAKSRIEPRDLTTSEIIKLHGYLSATVTQIEIVFEMHDRGLGYGEFADSKDDPAVDALQNFDNLINNRFGRAWYSANREWIDPRITEIWDRALHERVMGEDDDWIEQIQKDLSQP